MKEVVGIYSTDEIHWVGDGFPVRSVFSYRDLAEVMDPFLLLDYASPTPFSPSQRPRGVGVHPHRGFETVTIVYQGELEHRDSAGFGGSIGPGDVQWMTAASGIMHEEMHSAEFTKKGGMFEVAQLWVNLPAQFKKSEPHYQTLLKSKIPSVSLPKDAGVIRVIAGEYESQKGPAHTFTPVNVWDLTLEPSHSVTLTFHEDYTTAIVVFSGELMINESHKAKAIDLVVFERTGTQLKLQAKTAAKVLILNGKPIGEPIVAYGPFVMNTREEIEQAFNDFRNR